MPKFKYQAFDEELKVIKNSIVDDDIDLATDQLLNKGYQIIWIKQITSLSDLSYKRTLSEELLASYCGEIATILDSGVSILRGLEILYEQSDKKNYKKVVFDVLTNVRKGMNLSLAMEKTGVFPSLLTDMVESGEISSHLTEILTSMENFYAREASIKGKIRSASIYPMILLAVSIGMILFFNFFVFSELKTIFEDLEELPALTNALIGSLEYLNSNPFVVISVIIAAILFAYGLMQIEGVKYFIDKLTLRIPVFGRVRMNILSSRVASSMAVFIRSAVPLVKVLSVVQSIVANAYISKLMGEAKEEITRGQNISDAFEDVQAFDSMMVQMIRIGEETGKLEEMLFKLADIYEKKSETGIERMVSLIEPVFTLVVGVLVAIVIVAMAMPIFDMSSMIR